jgi:hypothetical protein
MKGLAAMVLCLAVSGCGVALDSEPMPVPSGALPAPSPTASQSSAATDAPASLARLWFVRDDGLVAVTREFPGDTVTPPTIIEGLATGPEAVPTEDGLRTVVTDPITGQALVSIPEGDVDAAGSVVVVISPEAGTLPPSEQVLMLGQVVLSLTGVGYSSVAFVDSSGAPAAVPLPGGRLLDRPAVARDYAGLIIAL